MYLARIDCSFPVPDGALSFGPGCTVIFLLVWVLDGPQLVPSGPSLRAQFSWFPFASPQMLLLLFAPQLFWPRIGDLLPSLLTCEPTVSFPFLQSLGFGQTSSSCIFEVPHTAVRSPIPNRTNWILVQFASLSWSCSRLHPFGSSTSPLHSRLVRLLELVASTGRRLLASKGPGGAPRASAALPVALRALRPAACLGLAAGSRTRCALLAAGRCKDRIQRRSRTHLRRPKLHVGGWWSQGTPTLEVFRGSRPGWGHCKD